MFHYTLDIGTITCNEKDLLSYDSHFRLRIPLSITIELHWAQQFFVTIFIKNILQSIISSLSFHTNTGLISPSSLWASWQPLALYPYAGYTIIRCNFSTSKFFSNRSVCIPCSLCPLHLAFRLLNCNNCFRAAWSVIN